MTNTRIYLGIGAFVVAVVGAIGAYQCFSVYSDDHRSRGRTRGIRRRAVGRLAVRSE
jgi:hypothetical protein